MTHTITALDGTGDSTVPDAIVGYAPTQQSGNVVHELIDGSIAVTLIGDLPRAGSLELRYGNDVDAEAARVLLGRRSAFALVSSRDVVDMTFVRDGSMTPAMHDTIHGHWVFTVGFQETP